MCYLESPDMQVWAQNMSPREVNGNFVPSFTDFHINLSFETAISDVKLLNS